MSPHSWCHRVNAVVPHSARILGHVGAFVVSCLSSPPNSETEASSLVLHFLDSSDPRAEENSNMVCVSPPCSPPCGQKRYKYSSAPPRACRVSSAPPPFFFVTLLPLHILWESNSIVFTLFMCAHTAAGGYQTVGATTAAGSGVRPGKCGWCFLLWSARRGGRVLLTCFFCCTYVSCSQWSLLPTICMPTWCDWRTKLAFEPSHLPTCSDAALPCVLFFAPPHAVCVLGCPSTSCVSPVINDLVTSSLLLFLCKCSASPAGQVQSPLLLEDVGSVEGLRSLDYSPTPETLLSAELAHLLQGPLAAACPILVRASSPFILAFGYCVEGGWFN